MIDYPQIDPVAFHVGPVPIRWYGISYFSGVLLATMIAKNYTRKWREFGVTSKDIDAFSANSIIAIVIGGRIGFILFYQLEYYLNNPLDILKIWHGGMSFHGGLLGVLICALIFTKFSIKRFVCFGDLIACVAPVGLFLGRCANFINGELWGRVTNVPWAMVFPNGGPYLRHPSQIYEAISEGLINLLVLNIMVRSSYIRKRSGIISGTFFLIYGISRFVIEFYREPDADKFGYLTRGQAYCIPMLLIGIILIINGFYLGKKLKSQIDTPCETAH